LVNSPLAAMASMSSLLVIRPPPGWRNHDLA
jgi:hypothetical protein